MSKITCLDTDNTTTISYLTQWDINRKIHISKSDINITDTPPEVHFSNNCSKDAYVTEATIVGDYVELEVPNILLQESYPVFIYIYVWTEETSARTTYELKMPVRARKKPEAYIFDDNVLYILTIPEDGSVTPAKLSSDVQGLIDGKVNKSGDTMSGNLVMGGNSLLNLGGATFISGSSTPHIININNNRVINLPTPTINTQAANKKYVDDAMDAINNSKVNKSGDTMSGSLVVEQTQRTDEDDEFFVHQSKTTLSPASYICTSKDWVENAQGEVVEEESTERVRISSSSIMFVGDDDAPIGHILGLSTLTDSDSPYAAVNKEYVDNKSEFKSIEEQVELCDLSNGIYKINSHGSVKLYSSSEDPNRILLLAGGMLIVLDRYKAYFVGNYTLNEGARRDLDTLYIDMVYLPPSPKCHYLVALLSDQIQGKINYAIDSYDESQENQLIYSNTLSEDTSRVTINKNQYDEDFSLKEINVYVKIPADSGLANLGYLNFRTYIKVNNSTVAINAVRNNTVIGGGTSGNYHFISYKAKIKNDRWEYETTSATNVPGSYCSGAPDRNGYIPSNYSKYDLNCTTMILSCTSASGILPAGTEIEIYGR